MSDGKAKIEEVGHLSRLLAAHEDMAILEDFTAKKPSVEERLAFGKAFRSKVPRADHARYEKSPDRPDLSLIHI